LTRGWRDLSPSKWDLIATRFGSLDAANGALREPVSSDAHASEQRSVVRYVVMGGLSVNQGWALVPDLVLRGATPVSHLITSDDDAWWQAVSPRVRALARCVPLAAKMLSGAWLYGGI
jgi:hypothetical protein